MDCSEETRRRSIPPAHAIEQPRGAELAGDSRTHVRDQQGRVQKLKEKFASHTHRHVHVGGVRHSFWKGRTEGPRKLGYVDLDRRKHSNNKTGKNRGQQNVAPWVLYLF